MLNEIFLSIIIPVFNEASVIQKTLLSLGKYPEVEIIVVDGGSKDNTIQLARELGIKVLISPEGGKALQMNWGASHAKGNVLLFLHADTILPPDYLGLIKEALSSSNFILGAFELNIDGAGILLRCLEKLVKLRSRFFSLPYGDQALFLKTATFRAMGGFSHIPIMEDFELVQRLKKRGKIYIIPAPVLTSNRRWRKLGIVKTTLINQLVILGYYGGVSPHKLACFYRNFGK